MIVWRILRPAGMVQYVGDRLKLLNDGRSTRAGEGMLSPSIVRLFLNINKHVKESLIEHPTTRNDGMEHPSLMGILPFFFSSFFPLVAVEKWGTNPP